VASSNLRFRERAVQLRNVWRGGFLSFLPSTTCSSRSSLRSPRGWEDETVTLSWPETNIVSIVGPICDEERSELHHRIRHSILRDGDQSTANGWQVESHSA
jgi:hypothetical protein